jgi:hypothetical protein
MDSLKQDEEEDTIHRRRSATVCCNLIGLPVPREWAVAMRRVWWYRVSSFAYCITGSLAAVRPEPLSHYVRWLPPLPWAALSPFCFLPTLPLRRQAYPCCTHFPFRSMGFAIALNGLASYASDVLYLGEPLNPWKQLDICLATANTVVQERLTPTLPSPHLWWRCPSGRCSGSDTACTLPRRQVFIAVLQAIGYLSYPARSGAVFAVSVGTALYCKRRSVLAVLERDLRGCIFWHALWHYTLPGGAFLAQLLLSWESTEPLLKDGL